MGKRVIVKQLKDLKPNPANPRRITDEQLEMLKKSLEEFGDLDGFVFNRRSNQLIGAHQRTSVSPKNSNIFIDRKFDEPTKTGTVAEGWIEINGERHKYREVDVDEQREKAMNIAANKHGGEFEMSKLTEWLHELDAHNYDLSTVGFTNEELENIMAPIHGTEGLTDADAVPDAPKEAKTKRGELWLLGTHRVLCGDATDKADVERLINGEKADLLFSSPPYSDQRDYGGSLVLDPKHLAKCLLWPASVFALNLGLQKKDHEVFPYWNAYLDFAKDNNLKLLSWNVWDKQGCGSVGHQTAMFPMEHEWIFVWGEPRKLNKTEENKWANTVSTGNSQREKDGSITKRKDIHVGTHRPIGTVLRMSPHKARNLGVDHPAMFPVSFPEKYIEAITSRGAIVAEPFTGSGSTLIACEQTGRACFGMEIEPLYIDVILTRWAKFTGKDPVREDGVTWSELSAS